MNYKDYVLEKLWMNLRMRGVSTKHIQQIWSEFKEDLSNVNEVLKKYNIDLLEPFP